MKTECECGCGEFTKSKRMFIKGHKYKDKDGNPILPWEQQNNESAESYSAFQDFLTLGPGRDLYEMNSYLAYGNYTELIRWAGRYTWMSRAKEYDKYLIQVAENQADRELAFIRIRQKKIARSMQTLGMRKVKDLLERDDIEELSMKDALMLVEKSIRIESTASELPTEIIHEKSDVNVSVEKIDPKLIEEIGRKLSEENDS